jgi:predicted nucleic acid-binding protein
MLDAGELEAISLATQMECRFILMDERDGRAEAAALGIVPIGMGGILVLAKQRRLIAEVLPLLRRLQSGALVWMSRGFFQQIAAMAGEKL